MKLALIGYGRMGRAAEQVAVERGHDVLLRARSGDNEGGRAISAESMRDVDVAIEFTAPGAAVENIERLAAAGVDMVVGTTGWYDALSRAEEAVDSAGVGLIYAPNFSLGTAVFFRLARYAARLMEPLDDYDPYVLEAHHRHKRDAPSGTARRLAELVLEAISRKRTWRLGTGDGPIDPATLQVTAVRAGENPGMHALGLDGPDDRLELRHEARGRSGFARGAVAAAEWIRGRTGVYTLDDMLADTLEVEEH